jgi:SagB-type dehydrogenase family enzyme
MGGGDLEPRPSRYKEYQGCRRIELPSPKSTLNSALNDVLRNRRSVRNFSPKLIDIGNLSVLLWASTGIQRNVKGYEFRTAPSAGALYPIETYLVVNRVKDLTGGVYHYSVKSHLLEEIKLGEFGNELASAALDQKMCSDASVVFLWTAIFARSRWRYKQRGYRYIYLDAGHIAQNLALAAVSLGLGSCQIGAFFDDEINSILEIDGVNESAVYLSAIGCPQ